MTLSVSVVIPTVGRDTLYAAVESVLTQSLPPGEVLVCADTDKPLNVPSDPRVRIIRVGPKAGGNVARQAGISAATSDLIALLDDDDVWVAQKLENQLSYVEVEGLSNYGNWLLTSRLVDTDGEIRPAIAMAPGADPVKELFRKTHVKEGLGKLHTSTWLFPKELGIRHPFRPTTRFHQDLEWLVSAQSGLESFFVAQLESADVVCGDSPVSVAKGIDWQASAEWGVTNLAAMSARVRGDFLLHVSFSRALASRSVVEACKAGVFALRHGRPGLPSCVAAIAKIARLGAVNLKGLSL